MFTYETAKLTRTEVEAKLVEKLSDYGIEKLNISKEQTCDRYEMLFSEDDDQFMLGVSYFESLSELCSGGFSLYNEIQPVGAVIREAVIKNA